MQSIVSAFFGSESESRDYAPLLKWVLVNALVVFGLVVCWYLGLLQQLGDDHSRISWVILGIFFITALHCFIQTVVVSRELIVARRVKESIVAGGRSSLRIVNDQIMTADGRTLEPGIMTRHIANLFAKARTLGGHNLDQTLLLRSLADQLRSREKLGLFIAEGLLRLALLGTAIGFIFMLIPISGLDAFDPETLRGTLTGMSDGMRTALYVTVTGIAAALILKYEYYLLDEAIADLFHLVTEVTEVHVVPSLERASDVSGG